MQLLSKWPICGLSHNLGVTSTMPISGIPRLYRLYKFFQVVQSGWFFSLLSCLVFNIELKVSLYKYEKWKSSLKANRGKEDIRVFQNHFDP